MRGQSSSIVVAGKPVSLPLASLPPVISSVSISTPNGTNSGETITAVPIAWDKYNDLSYEYQWYRSDDASGTSKAAISGETGADYVVQAIDENKFLTCKATPSNSVGDTGSEAESEYEEIIFATWTAYFDNTYWEAGSGNVSWNSGTPSWNSGDGGVGGHNASLVAIGTWADGFRPSKIRVTWNELAYVTDSSMTLLTASGTVRTINTSGAQLDITLTENITGLGISMEFDYSQLSGEIKITNIEFYA